MGVTGYDAGMYRDFTRIAESLHRIAEALDRAYPESVEVTGVEPAGSHAHRLSGQTLTHTHGPDELAPGNTMAGHNYFGHREDAAAEDPLLAELDGIRSVLADDAEIDPTDKEAAARVAAMNQAIYLVRAHTGPEARAAARTVRWFGEAL